MAVLDHFEKGLLMALIVARLILHVLKYSSHEQSERLSDLFPNIIMKKGIFQHKLVNTGRFSFNLNTKAT